LELDQSCEGGPLRAAGRYELPAFVPVMSLEPGQRSEPGQDVRSTAIELVIGAVTVRVPAGAEARDIEAVLRAVWRSNA
jgi:hypothetical protein